MKTKFKKVRSFKEVQNHHLVAYVDGGDYDPTEHIDNRCDILIGLKDGWKCLYNDCGIISASSKKDAIMKFNQIVKN